jgi:acetoin utilization deacetylase AcuC-like enzyme
MVPAPLACVETIQLIHDAAYVDAFVNGTIGGPEMRRIGFPWSPELVTRTLASAGGTLAAAHDAMETGHGGTLAGGTHHAFPKEGSGYCVFNDIAIAIAELRRQGRARRAAVIDLDVHQGDGTAAIFAGDPDVFTLSLHGSSNFPFRKQASTLDVALADGTGDAEYLEVLGPALDAVAAFQADVVFYQSGVDGLAEDRLGRLALTKRGLAERDRLVFDAVRCPLIVTLGGGYAEPIERTVEAAAQTYRMLAQR